MKTNIRILIGIIFVSLSSLLTSCKKDPITPGNYQAGQPAPPDTTNWQDQYSNGGVLPTGGGTTINELVGTTWVLTKYVTSFATTYPNDTLRFTSNTQYTINNGAVRNYQLTTSVASTNKTLSLYYFYPFGGSHYSAEVGATFVADGQINNAEFTNIQNTTDLLKAWFVKQ